MLDVIARIGPTQTIAFTFDGTVTAGMAIVTEGIASAGAPTFSGTAMTVPLTGVSDIEYVTVYVSNVSTTTGGTGGTMLTRAGVILLPNHLSFPTGVSGFLPGYASLAVRVVVLLHARRLERVPIRSLGGSIDSIWESRFRKRV